MEMKEFIQRHEKDNVSELKLRYHDKSLGFSLDDALIQIECRQKTKSKLPHFSDIIYPSVQASEQASHEAVAQLHAELIGYGKKVLDMTAGLGIDAMTIAMRGNYVTAVEMDSARAETLKQNVNDLSIPNLSIVNGDSVEYIASTQDNRIDCIFIDPARRDNKDGRVFRLQDSLPDVTKIMPLMLRKAYRILVKGSPLLDLTQVVRDLPQVDNIYIISFRGEVKEVLLEANADLKTDLRIPKTKTCLSTKITIIDIYRSGDDFPKDHTVINYRFECELEETSTNIEFSSNDDIKEGNYIYEPLGALRKLKVAHILNHFPGLKILSKNSDLYISQSEKYLNLQTSEHKELSYFPGRIMKIMKVLDNKDLKLLQGENLRIVSRGYPLSAEQIRKKYKIKEGDKNTLYAITTEGGKSKIFIAG